MTSEVLCPKCASENVVFSKKRGACICEDYGHILTEAPVAPLRIFLSYDHDANEELIRRIKADLEKRGHDVWFNMSKIKQLLKLMKCERALLASAIIIVKIFSALNLLFFNHINHIKDKYAIHLGYLL